MEAHRGFESHPVRHPDSESCSDIGRRPLTRGNVGSISGKSHRSARHSPSSTGEKSSFSDGRLCESAIQWSFPANRDFIRAKCFSKRCRRTRPQRFPRLYRRLDHPPDQACVNPIRELVSPNRERTVREQGSRGTGTDEAGFTGSVICEPSQRTRKLRVDLPRRGGSYRRPASPGKGPRAGDRRG